MSDGMAELRNRVAALEHHVSELEKSLESARKERDAATIGRIVADACAKRAAEARDVALADSAALVEALAKTRDELDEMVGIRAGEALRAVCRQPHPGATLLEEHRKALARAMNEGLEKAAESVDHQRRGGAGCAMVLAHCAHEIRAMKDPEGGQ